MNAYVITLLDQRTSCASYEVLCKSHKDHRNQFPVAQFEATTPLNVRDQMEAEGLRWTYPWDAEEDGPEGLRLHPYATRNRDARMACFMSHYRLWQHSAESGEWIIVLEDDARFVKHLDPEPLTYCGLSAVGINDPRGATRRSNVFHALVTKAAEAGELAIPVPEVDEPHVPQGLAGHSAYMVSPKLSQQLIDKAKELGCWPNDALMCRQLFPDIGVSTTYYTTVQHTPSTLA